MPDGHATLTADTLLKMRSEVDVCMAGGGDDDDDDDDNDVVVGEVVVSIRLSGDNCLIETVERTDDNCI